MLLSKLSIRAERTSQVLAQERSAETKRKILCKGNAIQSYVTASGLVLVAYFEELR